MVQHQDYHYTDWDTIGSNIPYCSCQLRFHLQLRWGCIRFQTKLYCVMYINYKARFHMRICWGCVSFRTKFYVSFSTKYYCVMHITSCRAAPLQYLSQYWQAQHSMPVRSCWSFIMITQKRQFIEMFMNILWWQHDYKLKTLKG